MNYSEENPELGAGTPSRRFSPATKTVIEKYTRSVCCLCRNYSYSAASDAPTNVNYGEAAHIKAVSNAWPRFDPYQSDEECRDASNGLWLCRICHKKIDDKNSVGLYTTDYLYSIKEQARAFTMVQNNQPFLAVAPSFREEEKIADNFRKRLSVLWSALHQRDRQGYFLSKKLYNELQSGAKGFQEYYGGSWGIENPLRSVSPAHYPQQDLIMSQTSLAYQLINKYFWVDLADKPGFMIPVSWHADQPIYAVDDNEHQQTLSTSLTNLALMIEQYMKQPNQLYPGIG